MHFSEWRSFQEVIQDSLSSDLDELPEQSDPLAELLSKAHLGRDPVLDLIEAAQEHIKVRRDGAEIVAPKYQVDQLILWERKRQIRVE